jgi:hypothetical protein
MGRLLDSGSGTLPRLLTLSAVLFEHILKCFFYNLIDPLILAHGSMV